MGLGLLGISVSGCRLCLGSWARGLSRWLCDGETGPLRSRLPVEPQGCLSRDPIPAVGGVKGRAISSK